MTVCGYFLGLTLPETSLRHRHLGPRGEYMPVFLWHPDDYSKNIHHELIGKVL